MGESWRLVLRVIAPVLRSGDTSCATSRPTSPASCRMPYAVCRVRAVRPARRAPASRRGRRPAATARRRRSRLFAMRARMKSRSDRRLRYFAVSTLTPPTPRASVPSAAGSVPCWSMAAHAERSARRTMVVARCRWADPGGAAGQDEGAQLLDLLEVVVAVLLEVVDPRLLDAQRRVVVAGDAAASTGRRRRRRARSARAAGWPSPRPAGRRRPPRCRWRRWPRWSRRRRAAGRRSC